MDKEKIVEDIENNFKDFEEAIDRYFNGICNHFDEIHNSMSDLHQIIKKQPSTKFYISISLLVAAWSVFIILAFKYFFR